MVQEARSRPRRLRERACCQQPAKDAAWELVKYLASADYQRAFISVGSDAPSRSSVLNGPAYVTDTPPPKGRKVMAESVKYGKLAEHA